MGCSDDFDQKIWHILTKDNYFADFDYKSDESPLKRLSCPYKSDAFPLRMEYLADFDIYWPMIFDTIFPLNMGHLAQSDHKTGGFLLKHKMS